MSRTVCIWLTGLAHWSSTRCSLQGIYIDTQSHSKAAWSGNEAMKYTHTLTEEDDSPLLGIHTSSVSGKPGM